MAGEIQFSITVKRNTPLLDRARRVLSNPMGEGRGAALQEELRASVKQEFRQHGWSRPSGGVDRWKEALPFGKKPEGEPLGGEGGFLARAWAGGQYGFAFVNRDRAGIGVVHPAAPMHRGGRDTDAGHRKTIIRPRKYGKNGVPAMFWYLGLRYGAWISPRRLERGLEVPSRPHATTNPELVRRLERRFAASLLGAAA